MSDEDQAPKRIVEGAGRAGGRARVSGTTSTRLDLSIQHLKAAALFSRRVGEIELEYAGKPFGPFFEEIIGNSLGCVSLSVAGLEAYVNGLFADREVRFSHQPEDLVEKLCQLAEQKPFLEKMDVARLLFGLSKLDKGRRPAQDIATLIRLRNALIHFHPEWDHEEVGSHSDLSKALAPYITGSNFISSHQRLFPLRWISHSATSWAVSTCLKFLSDFETEAKLLPFIGAVKITP